MLRLGSTNPARFSPSNRKVLTGPGRGEGVLPYMGYIGMCDPKGYRLSAILVIHVNSVPILADFGHKWGMVFAL